MGVEKRKDFDPIRFRTQTGPFCSVSVPVQYPDILRHLVNNLKILLGPTDFFLGHGIKKFTSFKLGKFSTSAIGYLKVGYIHYET
jgi:hypothetical protein